MWATNALENVLESKSWSNFSYNVGSNRNGSSALRLCEILSSLECRTTYIYHLVIPAVYPNSGNSLPKAKSAMLRMEWVWIVTTRCIGGDSESKDAKSIT